MLTLADVIWPAMLLEQRLLAVWLILFGLLIELFFVRGLTRFSWPRSIAANLAMNAVSCLLGILLLPIAGLAWELVPGILLSLFGMGTFNPFTWASAVLLAVFINTWLEYGVLVHLFKASRSRKLFWWLALANALSVGAGMISLVLDPPRF